MDTNFMLFVLSIGVFMLGAVDFITNFRQWKSIKRVQGTLEVEIEEWKGKGTVGEQIGTWLLHREKPEDQSNLEVLSGMAGSAMFKSGVMSTAGQASGDSRRGRAIEGRVMEAVKDQNPELKLISSIAEKLGLADIPLPELIPILQKYNLIPASKNNGEVTAW